MKDLGIYYIENLECYVLKQKGSKGKKFVGKVLLKTKGLSKKQIINKLIDLINNKKENKKHYKSILQSLVD